MAFFKGFFHVLWWSLLLSSLDLFRLTSEFLCNRSTGNTFDACYHHIMILKKSMAEVIMNFGGLCMNHSDVMQCMVIFICRKSMHLSFDTCLMSDDAVLLVNIL